MGSGVGSYASCLLFAWLLAACGHGFLERIDLGSKFLREWNTGKANNWALAVRVHTPSAEIQRHVWKSATDTADQVCNQLTYILTPTSPSILIIITTKTNPYQSSTFNANHSRYQKLIHLYCHAQRIGCYQRVKWMEDNAAVLVGNIHGTREKNTCKSLPTPGHHQCSLTCRAARSSLGLIRCFIQASKEGYTVIASLVLCGKKCKLYLKSLLVIFL